VRVICQTALFLLLVPLLLPALEGQTQGFYKSHYDIYRTSLFNPDKQITELLQKTPGPHFSFSQYVSLQAKILSFQWQLDFQGQAVSENTGGWKTDLKINQFFLQKDVFGNFVFIVGRSIQRWGTGYAFNPSDVVAPEKELSDPDNSEKQAVGHDLAMLEYFGASSSVAVCFLTKLESAFPLKMNGSKLAFRFYKNLWSIDLSAVALFNKEETPIWGGNFSRTIGKRLEIHGEFSFQKNSYLPYHLSLKEKDRLFEGHPFSCFKRNDHKMYHQYLLGFQYTLPGNILWVAEVYHRGQGYSKPEWKQLIDYVQFLNGQGELLYSPLVMENMLWSLNVFGAKGAMRDYLVNHVQSPDSHPFRWTASCLINLADASFVLIPEFRVVLHHDFTFYGRCFMFQGRKETEFGEFFQGFSLEGGIRFRL
jgi:hypothetical protein